LLLSCMVRFTLGSAFAMKHENGPVNFLFIITDRQRADHLGCYGNPVLRTPHIDALARKGFLHERYYAASPICMPNRSSMLTGRMPSVHGVRGNGVPLPLDTTTIVDLLRAAGYRTGLIGKAHLQNNTGEPPIQTPPEVDLAKIQPPPHLREANAPISEEPLYYQEWARHWWSNPEHDLSLPYYGFDHVSLCIKHGDMVHGHYGRWLEQQHPGSDKLRGPKNALPGAEHFVVPNGYRTAVPEELYPTTYVADETIRFLERHTQDHPERPFFLQCSFPDPHWPFTPPGRYWDMYDPDDMPLPPSFAGNEQPPIPYLTHLRGQRDSGTRPSIWDNHPLAAYTIAIHAQEAREAIALTYGMISMVDDAVGRIVNHLEKRGLTDNTVIIFKSDHGDFMGDHQLLTMGPIHYQGLIRVPFIWVDPARKQDGKVSRALAGDLDFAPTILDRAGLQPHFGIQGKSLMPLIRGDVDTGDECLLIEEENQRILMGFDEHPRCRTLLMGPWRLTIYDRVRWGELYNLEEDPDEMRNLWDDPAHLKVKCDILDRMVHRMTELADRAPFPIGRS